MNILFIADQDDPDVIEVTSRLTPNSWEWIRTGVRGGSFEIFMNSSSATLSQSDRCIDDSWVASARAIIYRRWRTSPPIKLVEPDLDDDISRYIAREWNSALDAVFDRWYRKNPHSWSRRPGDAPQKQVMLDQISDIVDIPCFTVATRPESFPGVQSVLKPISNNQHFRDSLRASTIEVDVRALSSESRYPRLVQRLVEVDVEIRLSYVFGRVHAVAQRSSLDSPIDRRYATDFVRYAYPASASLSRQAQEVAERLQLRVYTADILVDHFGKISWIDVNPDGLHIASDDSSGTLIGGFAGKIRDL